MITALDLYKTAWPSVVEEEDDLVYFLTVTNVEPTVVSNIVLQETYPPGFVVNEAAILPPPGWAPVLPSPGQCETMKKPRRCPPFPRS